MTVKGLGNSAAFLMFSIGIVSGLAFSQGRSSAHVSSVFLKQPHAPITAVSQSNAAVVLKNVSRKLIVNYTLACFQERDGNHVPVAIFSDSNVPMGPGKTLFEGGFDGPPVPHACMVRRSLVGVAQVIFSDRSSWTSSLMQNAPRELEKIYLPD